MLHIVSDFVKSCFYQWSCHEEIPWQQRSQAENEEHDSHPVVSVDGEKGWCMNIGEILCLLMQQNMFRCHAETVAESKTNGKWKLLLFV